MPEFTQRVTSCLYNSGVASLSTSVGWRCRRSPQYPKPSVSLFYEIKGSTNQESTQSSDPVHLQPHWQVWEGAWLGHWAPNPRRCLQRQAGRS